MKSLLCVLVLCVAAPLDAGAGVFDRPTKRNCGHSACERRAPEPVAKPRAPAAKVVVANADGEFEQTYTAKVGEGVVVVDKPVGKIPPCPAPPSCVYRHPPFKQIVASGGVIYGLGFDGSVWFYERNSDEWHPVGAKPMPPFCPDPEPC